MKSRFKHLPPEFFYTAGFALIMTASVVFLGFQNHGLKNELTAEKESLARLEIEHASTTKALEGTTVSLTSLEQLFATTAAERNTLAQNLEIEKAKTGSFEQQIAQITNTVGTLKKLSETDSELLQKYSKVYFLNEHYIPQELSKIDADVLFEPDKEMKIHSAVWPFLKGMLTAAKNAGIDIKIVSGYRSFGEQTDLKTSYKITYGSGANQFSADQGYSEHQLGTTVDLTTVDVGGTYVTFEKTTAFKWLTENAHHFGFTLSYPKNNVYYEYEPWHWRFVGRALAEKLHTNNAYFYDIDQRDINSYLISIFN